MEISSIDTILSAQTDYSQKAEKETGIDTFLTMLVAQLKHQDPLNPMNGTDFAVQLAQFTSLEQQFKTNDFLESIQGAMEAQEEGDLFNYIGKNIRTFDNRVYVENKVAGDIAYSLGDRAQVSVTITNSDGKVIKRFDEGWQEGGSHVLKWDGKDNQGNAVEDGVYSFSINALNEQGGYVSLSTYTTGEVSGVSYKSGVPYLMVGEHLVSPSSVVEITKTLQEEEAL